MPVTTKTLFDQFDDLRDQYALKQITRDEFIKRMEVLTLDHQEAQTEAALIDQDQHTQRTST